jgi:transcriptional regulator with XRE-family HTH domain
MSVTQDFWLDSSQHVPLSNAEAPPTDSVGGERRLHRIAEVRRNQGMSVRSVARRMGTTMEQVRRQEDPQTDLPLSELYQWHSALEVPVSDLLVESNSPLSEPILTRARLLRIMKTVRALKDSATAVSVLRFATMLEQQLVELMPELEDVAPWHSVGKRRSPDELGRTAERVIPDALFGETHEY